MLQFNGRQVSWFGVGAPDAIGPGIAALQASLTQYGVPGVNRFGDAAVAGLQAAGNVAVGAVGPAIDALSGNSPDVMKLTQQAWQANGKLATVNRSDTAGQADVDAAKAIVTQMIAAYQQATRLAASLAPKIGPRSGSALTAPPASPGASEDSPWWFVPALIVGGAVVIAGGIALVGARTVSPT